MAGNHANWFKVQAGPLKGQTVYLTKDQRTMIGGDIQAKLNAGSQLAMGVADSKKPKAAAKSAGRATADALKAKAASGKKAPAAKPAKPAASAAPQAPAQAATARRSFQTTQEGVKYAHGHYDAWGQGLSKTHDDALHDYQQAGYLSLNRDLRGGNKPTTGDKKLAKELDAAIDTAPPLTESITVHRGMRLQQDAPRNLFDSWEVGGEYSDPGYMSTTLSAKTAKDFGDPNLFEATTIEIRLPKGQKAAFMQARRSTDPDLEDEQEILLPRNTRYRVVSKTRVGRKRHHVVLEII